MTHQNDLRTLDRATDIQLFAVLNSAFAFGIKPNIDETDRKICDASDPDIHDHLSKIVAALDQLHSGVHAIGSKIHGHAHQDQVDESVAKAAQAVHEHYREHLHWHHNGG
jgi:hypothetical protein